MEKENNSDESDFSENEIPDLNSLKPFEFEPKANIGDINSSSSDDEEEAIGDKLKWIGNSEWCEYSKQCKPLKNTPKVYAVKKEMMYLNGTSKVSVSRYRIFIRGFPNAHNSAPF